MKFLLFCLIFVGSCSYKKTGVGHQNLKGHDELYSRPTAPQVGELEKGEKRIVIAATNDIQGNFRPLALRVVDEKNPTSTIRVGGVDVINNYFKILKHTYQNVLLVDSGNILNDSEGIKHVSDFYDVLGYDALTIGLRDFNLKVPESLETSTGLLKKFSTISKTPLIISNLYDLKTSRVVEWKGTKPYIIKDINGIKVGILGLIPDDIIGQTPINNRVGFYVESMLQSTLRHARLLRSMGAEVIVTLTNQGLDCVSEQSLKTKLPEAKVNFEPNQSGICDLKSPMGQFLERLPPGLVDVVIGGRINKKMANFVNGTLILSAFDEGKSFSYAEFTIDSKNKKVIPSKTLVHQPVMFCHEFFNATKDCYPDDSSVDHTKRIPATFLGTLIERDLSFEKKFPDISTDRNLTQIQMKHQEKALTIFNADIAYTHETSGQTQLIVLNLPGKKLAQILDEDFNFEHRTKWSPSPFVLNKEELTLNINNTNFDYDKTYRILTDLESVQKHRLLNQEISSISTESLANHSWISLDQDSVSSSMAAQTR